MLAALIDGMSESGGTSGAGATGVSAPQATAASVNGNATTRNGSNLASALSIMEMCWGDVGLLLSIPRQGLGNSAIASVADDEQLERFGGRWAAMAITEPEAGSDSAAIRTTAVLDGDEYVLNGEKIYVTAGERAELVVVWATLDRAAGRAAIKSFVVERSNPGLKLIRLEDKLGIRASDTAAFSLENCRVPKEALLGTPDIDAKKGFARRHGDVRQHAPAGRRDGVGVAGGARPTRDALAGRGGHRGRPGPPRARAVRRGGRAAGYGGRLRGRAAADDAGGVDGRQRQAELAARVDGEGEGGPRRRPTSRCAASRSAARPATARPSCSRSGRATRRSSTSSRARSRSSC